MPNLSRSLALQVDSLRAKRYLALGLFQDSYGWGLPMAQGSLNTFKGAYLILLLLLISASIFNSFPSDSFNRYFCVFLCTGGTTETENN